MTITSLLTRGNTTTPKLDDYMRALLTKDYAAIANIFTNTAGLLQNSLTRLNTIADSVRTSVADAQTAATQSEKSETNAKTSETNAKSSETAAASSADSSAFYQGAAKTSETNSKTSETNSATSEANAKKSETNSKTSETNAAASESSAASLQAQCAKIESDVTAMKTIIDQGLRTFASTWLGELDADPKQSSFGDPLVLGAEYYNKTEKKIRVYTDTGWKDQDAAAAADVYAAQLILQQVQQLATTTQSAATTAKQAADTTTVDKTQTGKDAASTAADVITIEDLLAQFDPKIKQAQKILTEIQNASGLVPRTTPATANEVLTSSADGTTYILRSGDATRSLIGAAKLAGDSTQDFSAAVLIGSSITSTGDVSTANGTVSGNRVSAGSGGITTDIGSITAATGDISAPHGTVSATVIASSISGTPVSLDMETGDLTAPSTGNQNEIITRAKTTPLARTSSSIMLNGFDFGISDWIRDSSRTSWGIPSDHHYANCSAVSFTVSTSYGTQPAGSARYGYILGIAPLGSPQLAFDLDSSDGPNLFNEYDDSSVESLQDQFPAWEAIHITPTILACMVSVGYQGKSHNALISEIKAVTSGSKAAFTFGLSSINDGKNAIVDTSTLPRCTDATNSPIDTSGNPSNPSTSISSGNPTFALDKFLNTFANSNVVNKYQYSGDFGIFVTGPGCGTGINVVNGCLDSIPTEPLQRSGYTLEVRGLRLYLCMNMYALQTHCVTGLVTSSSVTGMTFYFTVLPMSLTWTSIADSIQCSVSTTRMG